MHLHLHFSYLYWTAKQCMLGHDSLLVLACVSISFIAKDVSLQQFMYTFFSEWSLVSALLHSPSMKITKLWSWSQISVWRTCCVLQRWLQGVLCLTSFGSYRLQVGLIICNHFNWSSFKKIKFQQPIFLLQLLSLPLYLSFWYFNVMPLFNNCVYLQKTGHLWEQISIHCGRNFWSPLKVICNLR